MILFHPKWDRSCSDCRKWLYDEDGRVTRRPAFVGEPVPRHPHQKTPCSQCPKIPEGRPKVWTEAVELTAENRLAWHHYQECRAIGHFPDCSVVRRNAAIIREMEDAADRQPLLDLLSRIAVKQG